MTVLIGCAIVIGLAGAMMFITPMEGAAWTIVAPSPRDFASVRINRVGGGVLVALAGVLLNPFFLPE